MNPDVLFDLVLRLYILLVGLNVLDAAATIRALRAGAIERNPVIAAAVRRWGPRWGVIVPKDRPGRPRRRPAGGAVVAAGRPVRLVWLLGRAGLSRVGVNGCMNGFHRARIGPA